jgi:hypothetical protein
VGEEVSEATVDESLLIQLELEGDQYSGGLAAAAPSGMIDSPTQVLSLVISGGEKGAFKLFSRCIYESSKSMST